MKYDLTLLQMPTCMVHEALIDNFHKDVNQTIDRLVSAWNAEHQQCVEAWNIEHDAEARLVEWAQAEQRQWNEEQAEQWQWNEEQAQLEEAEVEKEHKDAEKKKPKIDDFNENRPAFSIITPCPSQYAIQKIAAFDFVELWYSFLEGCTKAARCHKSQADDAFSVTNTNDILTLRPIASVKASRNACADYDFSFSEFLQAKNSFLQHLKQASWPNKHINALAEFFWHLENHLIWVNENSDLIALHYASRIHCQWHDNLKANTDSAFNISLINNVLINSIAFKIDSSIQTKVTCKVSPPPPPHHICPTNAPCFPFFC